VFLEESKPYDMPTAELSVSLNILGMTLLEFGTEEQKERHLPAMLKGDEIWLQLLSEPSGGSDLAGLLTSARRDGDTYVLNGQKTWSTGAEFADFALCPARTNWDVPKHRGISMFIVDLRAPGVEVRTIKQINGGTDFCEEFLTDVVVPAANLVGEEDDGWRVTRGMLAIEHEWVGRSGGNRHRPTDVDDLVSLARRRGLHGDAGVRRSISDVHVLQTVHLALTERVGKGLGAGTLHATYGGVLKLSNDTMRQRRNEVALELAGSRGVAWVPGSADAALVPTYLQSRSATIAGGSSEIQRNNISEGALGLPREISLDRDVPFRDVPKN
jgi:alkylation response protein AidB-like acyl-CoA dehydrogenase